MSYRSWLKDVRRLDDLANCLHHFPRHHSDWDREIELESREIQHIRNPFRPSNLDPDSYPFFEGSLHDGYVLGVDRTGDRLEISISHTNLGLFCDEYFAETEEDRKTILSPVRLTFEGVNYLNAVRTDAEGWLKWDDWEHWRSTDDLTRADSFIRGYFSEQDGKIQWVGHFQKYINSSRLDPWNLFLLVDCHRVTAEPESERALRMKMGDECYDAMIYIQNLPKEEHWLSTGHLSRYLDDMGIHRRHIPHQSERT